jgi:colanic acid/amylovoran biosynthesis glycosyltransferase
MKLAYVINMFPKLSESFILNEIVELLKNGHDVLIFSIIKPWEEVVHDDVGKYHILERTHYFSFKSILKINLIHFSKYLISIIIQDLFDFRTFYQTVSKPKVIVSPSNLRVTGTILIRKATLQVDW